PEPGPVGGDRGRARLLPAAALALHHAACGEAGQAAGGAALGVARDVPRSRRLDPPPLRRYTTASTDGRLCQMSEMNEGAEKKEQGPQLLIVQSKVRDEIRAKEKR